MALGDRFNGEDRRVEGRSGDARLFNTSEINFWDSGLQVLCDCDISLPSLVLPRQ